MKLSDFKKGDYVICELSGFTGIPGAHVKHFHASKVLDVVDRKYDILCKNLVNGKTWKMDFRVEGFVLDEDCHVVDKGQWYNKNFDKVRLATEAEVAEAMILAVGATNV